MSIVTLLKNDEFTDLKYYVKANTPKKKSFKSNVSDKPFEKLPMRVEYGEIEPYQARRIGHIADYMFSLVLARFVVKYKTEIYESLNWRALQLYEGCFKNNQLRKNHKQVELHFEEALKITRNFVDDKKIELGEVIQAAYTIFKMEDYLHYVQFYSGEQFLYNFLEPCDDAVVEQVKQLTYVFEETFIESGLVQKNSVVVCHPWFEPWSYKCGGGIADIYIDGILYDFKSTKEMGYHWDEVGQVYAYYLLNCLCKKDSKEDETVYIDAPLAGMEIAGIAIYFSRYGDIEKCELSQCGATVSEEDLAYLEKIINKHADDAQEKAMSEIERICNMKR